jgi:hypothetical protein
MQQQHKAGWAKKGLHIIDSTLLQDFTIGMQSQPNVHVARIEKAT